MNLYSFQNPSERLTVLREEVLLSLTNEEFKPSRHQCSEYVTSTRLVLYGIHTSCDKRSSTPVQGMISSFFLGID